MVVEVEQTPLTDFAVLARRLTHERMEYYGYPPAVVEQIERQMQGGAHHHVRHCERTEHGWDCRDLDDKPLHPNHDEYERTAELVVWLLEALDATSCDGRHKA